MRLSRLYYVERGLKRALNKEIGLPSYFIQILLSYLTLFLYSYLYVDKKIAERQSDYLIINRTPPLISENNFTRKSYILVILTCGLYMLLRDSLIYNQYYLVRHIEQKLLTQKENRGALKRVARGDDVIYLKPKTPKKKKHVDMADVIYLEKK